MGDPGRARHIDAAMDRMDPGRAGIGDDNAGGAEDRQPADNAEPRVQRLRRHLLAIRNGNLDLDIGRAPERARDFAIAACIIFRGTGLIAGSPGGTGRPGSVTVPTPGPALN